MAKFSISDLEKLTGIKAHTIRIWEQRYNLLKPGRTNTNIRFYNDDDLKLLMNVVVLLDNGYKISTVVSFSQKKIHELVRELMQKSGLQERAQIQALNNAMLYFDEAEFNRIMAKQLLQYGLETTMTDLVFPFLKQIGTLWMTDTIHAANEHFIVNLLKQKLYVAIDGQSPKILPSAVKFLIYLPESELHEIGVLFANYLIRKKGHHLVYLGANTPEEGLVASSESYRADYILTAWTNIPEIHDTESARIQLVKLSKLWPDAKILLTGSQILHYSGKIPKNIHLIHTIESLIDFLNKL